MNKLKISIHPLFYAFVILLIALGEWVTFFNYMAVLFLHELAHAYVARRLGYEINNISVMPFGIALNLKETKMYHRDEIIVALAGPMMNLILIILCVAMWWIIPVTYIVTNMFVFANAVTLVFNLIPILPLDGGRVMIGLLSEFFDRKKVCKWCYLFNIFAALLLFVAFTLSIYYHSINITYLFAGLFVLLAGIPTRDKTLLYSYNNITIEKAYGVIRTRIITLRDDTLLFKATKYLSRNYYLLINVVDDKGCVREVLDEGRLVELITKHNPTESLSFVIHR